ncbi:hypothetical protein COU15_01195 [Candidatus Kaiserbacteria bacterium CG10_big_fil_rev_8_21_14_0_10_45_20]|uniref:DUF5640 domain-containing protein n=1 Tax=Candidatus Kaiserbacteria bacterium CG10_big_fil_rev_8_21_14_0_10_45_20 TaxID=1974607 RepID=A0A2H0UFZ0_9BACT|nr:MAG: hypothetical protein COU15_01195 [Candidatus Kaiserbacteria bacterium CG10_big_fil_rev_8_21_14_0_10_45_20]
MNSKFIIVIIAVLVIGGAFWAWSTQDEKVVVENSSENEEMVNEAPLAPDSLAGVWRSVEDPKFSRTFYENGGYVDLYEGEEVSTNGPWVAFTAENPVLGFPYTLEPDVVYLELIDESGPLYFSIAELTEEKLVLIFLDRGGVLEFERI